MNPETAQPTLKSLFADIPVHVLAPVELPNTPITDIQSDSRLTLPGNLFVALSGGSDDGHRYIGAAVERGAAAVVGTQAVGGLSVPYVQVADSREALAYLAAAFYGFPARKLTVIGVTGTDGKTTTCNLIYSILRAAGIKAGIISTVNAVIGDEVIDTGFHVTTPEAQEVQHFLARMAAAGLTHVVLESTSHGLAQHRVDGCEFDIGVVTNITHEHLDYHGSYEAYRAAKGRLFTSLAQTRTKPGGNPRLAVLNFDDASYGYLHGITSVRQVDYSAVNAGSGLHAEGIEQRPDGLRFTVAGEGYRFEVKTPLVGLFNVSNILAAVGATVVGLGIAPAAVKAGIEAVQGVPGRMERIDAGQNFIALVDFAHTPNALKVALEAVRQLTAGRVIAVFGSAGLRDRAKRRMMAEVSAGLADITILTAEDPRTESLDGILAEMAGAAAAKGGVEGETFFRVADRGEALRLACQLARAGDVVVACGKGHEQSMCFGVTEYAWDDRAALRAALGQGEMPGLPTLS